MKFCFQFPKFQVQFFKQTDLVFFLRSQMVELIFYCVNNITRNVNVFLFRYFIVYCLSALKLLQPKLELYFLTVF